ncbi:MAG: diguanylate cyclase [Pseudomonadota bacterium]|nr:diguanylate cyclase [Pseudomonadota bacterium]
MRRLISRLLTCLCACLLATGLGSAGSAHAQDAQQPMPSVVIDTWNSRDGLNQVTVQAIAQDGEGYLWLGTQGGLSRFDGIRFEPFLPEQHPQLPALETRSLLWSGQALMIGTSRGIAVYQDGQFKPLPLQPEPAQPPTIHSLARCGDGVIWATTSQGLYSGDVHAMRRVEAVTGPVSALGCKAGRLWVGGHGQMLERNGNGWLPLPLPAAHADTQVNAIAVDGNTLWVGTTRGVLRWHDGQWQAIVAAALPAHSTITSLLLERSGALLAGGSHGLVRLRAGQVVDALPASGQHRLSEVRAILEDREGNLWLGTQAVGLIRLAQRTVRIHPVPGTSSGVITWSLAAERSRRDGGFWVGTSDGVYRFEDGRFQLLLPASALPHPHAYNLLAEPERLWIGTRTGLVHVDHPDPTRPAQVRRDPRLAPLEAAQINALVRGGDGGLWIGASNGLWQLDGDGLRQHHDPATLKRETSVQFLHLASDGDLLIGTTEGAFRLHGDAIRRLPLTEAPGELRIEAIHQLPSGDIVFGARDGRMFLQHGDAIQPMRQRRQLRDNGAFFMAVFDDHLWVSGISGISRFPLEQLERLASGQIDAPANEVVIAAARNPHALNQGNCCNGLGTSKGLVLDDTMYVPALGGVLSVRAQELSISEVAPIPLIGSVLANGSTLAHPGRGIVQLPLGARDLSFEFSLISLRDPGGAELLYRLQGFDDDWQLAEINQRRVQYTNLQPGRYRFEVIGNNAAGIPSAEAASIELVVPAYFRETPWFWLLLAGIGLGAVAATYRVMARLHHRREQMLEEMIEQRTQQLQEANHVLEHLSTTDTLTGLHNRRYLSDLMARDMAHYQRYFASVPDRGESMVVCVLDLDHFKSINDSWGHEAGDKLLQSFATLLNAHIRDSDHLVRWGGEEFVLVLRPMPREQVPRALQRLLMRIRQGLHEIGAPEPARQTCSIGAAEFPAFNADFETLIALADYALYQAKQHGRDNWALLQAIQRGAPYHNRAPNILEQDIAEGRIRVQIGPLQTDDAPPAE